ncbi:MAG: SUMF1/EgtB/PvdO family nonheme iron enzyme [Planctomycetes bacterium]|nr:SUMF1/EgtB/PvdO family nonheme iron enzyme [Planctomycetota bacterium]
MTRAEFAAFVRDTGHDPRGCQVHDKKAWRQDDANGWRDPGFGQSELDPVVCVSWDDAHVYVRWLSGKAGREYRLPSESEWEYAARGGLHDADYPWGREELPDGKPQANYWRVSGDQRPRALLPVKSFSPNGFGLYDMTGHVWQWCGDWYAVDFYAISPTENPTGARGGRRRVIRGGSWVGAEQQIAGYTVSLRTGKTPTACYHHVGFRCVKDVEARSLNR